ncbi:MAG: VCBS repeat-containing protein [Caldilineaceae bacterium]|nr:VCBS repeat-containing protein [Caldilineaceae bacterium]
MSHTPPPQYSLIAVLLAAALTASLIQGKPQPRASAQANPLTWLHLSTAYGNLAPPSSSTQQTAALVLDIDGDGVNDFVIASRRDGAPSVVWYRRHVEGWDRHLIDAEVLDIEAGGAFYDIDGDGDLDIVFGGDQRSNQIWWWENPAPDFDPDAGWTRRTIKNSGSSKHHDMIVGDFTGNGHAELVFWNQRAQKLMLAEIPADPHIDEEWAHRAIFTWEGDSELEGLAQGDINLDGVANLVGGGRWFEYDPKHDHFIAHVIDESMGFTRAAVGQLVAGGRPEVVFGAGDQVGPLRWYEWADDGWVAHALLDEPITRGHSLAIGDIDLDGHLDIFAAEMRLNGGHPTSRMWAFLGDSQGNFERTEVAVSYDNHESVLADLDGDGDLDILGKPYNHETPRLDIWLNQTVCQPTPRLWQRRIVDASAPWRTLFVAAADLTGNGRLEIVTGGWWYEHAGRPNRPWVRHDLGAPLANVAAVYDFDGDGRPDLFGSQWQAQGRNPNLAWARNDGDGQFTVLTNAPPGQGDFLQGVAIDRFQLDTPEVMLSWHQPGQGVQRLRVPADPSNEPWVWERVSEVSQNEALSAGDIDGDGHMDLLLGTQWLRNEPGAGDNPAGWSAHTLFATDHDPDRNRLADINQDGRLDAVVGYEAVSAPGIVAWYQQPEDPTQPWAEQIVATVIGPMSLDVADIDGDGDLDMIVGEHNTRRPAEARLLIFENVDGLGQEWRPHLVYRGDEHHDGALAVDIDNDGDLDIVSIGWTHRRVLLYENVAPGCQPSSEPTMEPTPTLEPTQTPTVTPSQETPVQTPARPTTTPQRTPIEHLTVTPEPTATPVASQDMGVVRGVVYEVAGDTPRPVQGEFEIELDARDGAQGRHRYVVTTSTQGVYHLPHVPVGDYWLLIIPRAAYIPPEPVVLAVTAGSVTQVEHAVSPLAGQARHRLFLPFVRR